MPLENILVEVRSRICYVTINRESKLNALNTATLTELGEAVKQALADSNVGGIIITGAGPKAFVAGADIAEFAPLNVDGGKQMAQTAQHNVFDVIEQGTKPVIAAVNGFALGGGLELAMACHIRIASANAKLGLPEVTLGLIPGYGGTQRLTRLIGRGRALEMILTADMITAEQALQFGLVNHVVDPDALLPKAEEIMNKILTRAPLAVAAAIRSVNASAIDAQKGFDTEIEEFAACFATNDTGEGIQAFIQKRKPEFKGE
ncbi:enoyl-CoA hydratase/isomerase family protein [Mucilaginibacter sp. JRF]|uniref:enoyl-CoA hydratase/isomerase family protein n=1 Tax=Mucilaginibacter sp. JRF TaxID=2780088 RepID=UPI00188098C5|nr:enoyl-CoA hydratase-related protein [Mucilaginibacter sp. JRF]MBE9583895.1 enoyl-CoA hydratase/isomerase family protein [Mucilaginibacter sp. JRF]